jgi:hypothetical protein
MKLEIELKIQKGIRDAEDEIVKSVQTALNKLDSYGDLEESQFRNLLNVATSTDSSEVVKNFLRYQTGRGDKWGKGSDSLAEVIITHITALHSKAKTILQEAQKVAEDKREIIQEKEVAKPQEILSNQSEEIENQLKSKEIHMELIRRYLGYGSRHLVYIKLEPKKTK